MGKVQYLLMEDRASLNHTRQGSYHGAARPGSIAGVRDLSLDAVRRLGCNVDPCMVSGVTFVSATGDGQQPESAPAARDIRLSGFGNRAEVSAAWAWLDSQTAASAAELVSLAKATGRVLADTVVAGGDVPDKSRSAENGFAVRAAECDGANAYNPMTLALLQPGTDKLAPGSACTVATGWTLPAGADAVLPFEAAQLTTAHMLEVLAPVAPGTGIERRRPGPRAGTPLLAGGKRLRPQDVSCLATLGIDSVSVLPRPRVALVVPGAKSGPDALTPLLRALLARDEALVEPIPVHGDDEHALATTLTNPTVGDCDLVLLAGRSGAGLDDTAAPAVMAARGTLALHGIALRPGGATGLGTLPIARGRGRGEATIPIILLPGDPLACLFAYDLLAARLVRRLAGAVSVCPYPAGEFELARKIVSELGTKEIVPVRLAGGVAQPIGIDAGLAAGVQADGFVVVAEASEGYPACARVRVHLYDPGPIGAAQDMMA
jgi:molybdopterin molybdotransferase